MGWATAITTGLQAASSLYGGNQARKAADAQRKAAEAAGNYAKGIYGDAQANFSPYLGLGQTGASGLQKLYGGDNSGWMNSPDYLAAQSAGQYAMDHSAAARGRLFSGGFQMDARKGQADIASGYLGNYRNGLMGLAGMGQGAAGSLGSIGTSISGQVGNAYGAAGDARAAHYGANAGQAAGLGSIFGNAISGLGGGSTASSYGGGSSASNFGLPAANGPLPGFGTRGWSY